MTCPAYGSSANVALYYTEDPDPSAALSTTLEWDQIRMTGETLDLALSSTISDEITPERSFANSKLSQGEISGGFNFEASKGFLDNFLISVLQSSKDLTTTETPTPSDPWADTEAAVNEASPKCLTLLKRVLHADSSVDIYVFRGVQVSSLSLSFQPSALVTGTVSVMGVGADDVRTSLPAGWTLNAADSNPLMSGVDSVQSLELQNSGGTDLGVIFQNFSLTLDNQLRQQFAVGTDNIFAAGLAAGRFMASMSASAYYSAPDIYSNFLADSELKVAFNLLDSADDGWSFLFDKVKITSGSTPQAGGPDQDLLISTELRGFESASNGTVKVTKVT